MIKAEHCEDQTAASYRKLFYSYRYLPTLACIVFFASACFVLFQVENYWLAAMIARHQPLPFLRCGWFADESWTDGYVLNAASRCHAKNASFRAWIPRKDALHAATQFFESC